MTRRRRFQFAAVAEAEICTFFHTLPARTLKSLNTMQYESQSRYMTKTMLVLVLL